MNPSNNPGSTPNTRNPYTIWFVVLAFVAPVVLAYFMFYFVDVTAFNNHGELLQPVIPAKSLQLKDENGKLVAEQSLAYKWRFISFIPSSCDQACQSRLIESRQIHKALGKDQHRVIQLVVQLAAPDTATAEFIRTELPDALIMNGDAATIAAAIAHNARLLDNVIYIQDPMGNIMMRFTQDQPGKVMHYDVRKLLKASQIG